MKKRENSFLRKLVLQTDRVGRLFYEVRKRCIKLLRRILSFFLLFTENKKLHREIRAELIEHYHIIKNSKFELGSLRFSGPEFFSRCNQNIYNRWHFVSWKKKKEEKSPAYFSKNEVQFFDNVLFPPSTSIKIMAGKKQRYERSNFSSFAKKKSRNGVNINKKYRDKQNGILILQQNIIGNTNKIT